ncbi:MAG: peptide ABC transporter substrate-binding protein [Planctomycetota bacterium]
MKSLRHLVFWLTVLLAWSTAAQAPLPKPPPLVIGTMAGEFVFDPALAYRTWDMHLNSALFETLLILGDDGVTLESGVAKAWEVSNDGLVYTFHLRKNAKWSDGKPVLADHFASGWFRALMPDTESDYAWLHYAIKGAVELRDQRQAFIQQWIDKDENAPNKLIFQNWKQLREGYTKSVWAEDDHTLKVRLGRANSSFPYLLVNPAFAPQPGRMMEHRFDLMINFAGRTRISSAFFSDPERAVYNGPYRLERWPEKGGDLHLVANGRYWNSESVASKKIHVRVFDDQQALLKAYDQQEIDWIPTIGSSPVVEKMVREKRSDVHRTAHAGTYYYEFNCRAKIDDKDNPYADPKLRRAIAHLFDREAMASIASTYHSPMRTLVPPSTMPGYEPAEDSAARFDVDLAKQLLQEAGYDDLGKLGPLVLLINEESSHVEMAQPLIKQLKAVGFDVRLETPDFRIFLERATAGDFHLRRAGWYADYHDPSSFLDLYAPWSDTDSGYDSEAFGKQYIAALRSPDHDSRMQRMAQAESILLKEAGCVPVSQYHHISLYDPDRIRLSESAWRPSRWDRVRKLNHGVALGSAWLSR